jgi:hypothetical protein
MDITSIEVDFIQWVIDYIDNYFLELSQRRY